MNTISVNTRILSVFTGTVITAAIATSPAMAQQPLTVPPAVFNFDSITVQPQGLNADNNPAQATMPLADLLDMPTAVRMAANWHPSIKSAVGNLQQSTENINVAQSGYFPQIRAGVNSELRNHNVNGYDTRRVHKATLSASQMLYDFGKVSSSVDRANARQIAARARVLLSIDQIARDTSHAVIEVQRYQRLTQLADEQIEGVSAIGDLARQRRASGASSLSDETQASAREDAARATRLQMQSQLQRWRMALAHLIGQSEVTAVKDETPVMLERACQVESPNWLMLPSVMAAEAERNVAQAELELATAEQLPTLSVDGSVGRGLNDASRAGRSNDASVMLNISAPVYQGGGLQASKRAASHALGSANAAVTQARLEASQGLLSAQSQAIGFMQRIGVLDGRTQSIRQTRDLYRQQYLDLGTRSLLDLLNAEQEYHQARIEAVNNKYDLHRLQIDCLYNTGRLRDTFALNQTLVAGVELQP